MSIVKNCQNHQPKLPYKSESTSSSEYKQLLSPQTFQNSSLDSSFARIQIRPKMQSFHVPRKFVSSLNNFDKQSEPQTPSYIFFEQKNQLDSESDKIIPEIDNEEMTPAGFGVNLEQFTEALKSYQDQPLPTLFEGQNVIEEE